jgi:hypothetical protein
MAMTKNQYVIAVVVGLVSAFSKGIGDYIAGRFEPWMVLPMGGFGIVGATIYLIYRFLRNLQLGLRSANAEVVNLRGELSAVMEKEKRERNSAYQQAVEKTNTVEAALTKEAEDCLGTLDALGKQVGTVRDRVDELWRQSSAHKEAIGKVTAALVQNGIEEGMTAANEGSLSDVIKPPKALPIEVVPPRGLLDMAGRQGPTKK